MWHLSLLQVHYRVFFANVFVLLFFWDKYAMGAETLQQLIALIGSLSQVGAARLAINRSFLLS